MPEQYTCPAGHTWQTDGGSERVVNCPQCGATGTLLPLPTVIPPDTALGTREGRQTGGGVFQSVCVPGYEILRELGRGGMGVVYLARQQKLGRLVALKMVLSGPHVHPVLLRRFQIEAEAVAALQHPNIVQIYEMGEIDGLPWFAMEFVPGETLSSYLAKKPQPPTFSAAMVEILARAIDHAHQRGILHRDLKPANVLLQTDDSLQRTPRPIKEEDNLRQSTEPFIPSVSALTTSAVTAVNLHPKITDFGLARKLQDQPAGNTRGGDILGTPSYMSPEQASGVTQNPTPAIDIWALGAILYECLTGRPPFLASTPIETVMQVLSKEPVSPRLLEPSVPVDLETITLKCLEKEPRRRYSSAVELADDLGRFLRDEPIHARPLSTFGRMVKWAHRRPVAASFLGFVILSVLTFTGLVLGYNRSLRVERDQARKLQGEAEQARSEEQQQRRQAEDRLLREYLTRSTQLLERGDAFGALPLQVEALALDGEPKTREQIHRLRLGTTLASGPRLVQLWRQEGGIHDVAFSPDASLVAAAGSDGSARIYRVATGEVQHTLLHGAPVLHVAFHPEGKILATGDDTGGVRLWDVPSGKTLRAIVRHPGAITSLSFSADGRRLLSSSRAGTALVQEGRGTGDPLTLGIEGKVAEAAVLFAGFSPDGRLIVTTSEDQTARLWRADSGEPVGPKRIHSYPVRHAVFTADAKQFLTAASRYRSSGGVGQLVVWDVEAKKPPRVFQRSRAFRRLALAEDFGQVIVALHTGQVQVWDLASGEPILNGEHRGPVVDVELSPDQRRFLSAGNDSTVQVWEVHQSLVPVVPALRHGGAVTRALFDRTGRLIVSAGTDGTVRLWDLAPVAPSVALVQLQVTHAVYSPDGKKLATASREGAARIWDAGTGDPLTDWMLHGRRRRIEQIRWSPTGKYIATAGFDGDVRLWNSATGNLLWIGPGHKGRVRDLTFDPNEKRLVSCGEDGLVRQWEVQTGKPMGVPIQPGAGITSIEWLPGTQKIVLLLQDETVRIWQLAPESRELHRLEHRTPGTLIDSVRAGRDGLRLVTAGTDGMAMLWDAVKGKPIGPGFRYHTGLSQALFDPPGKQVAATALDRTVNVWEVASGKRIAGPLAHPDLTGFNLHTLQSADFNLDGSLLITGASNGMTRIWNVEAGELLAPPRRTTFPVVQSTTFHPDGKHFLYSAYMPGEGGFAAIHDLQTERMPLSDLRRLAMVMSSQQVGSDGRLQSAGGKEIAETWQTLRKRYSERFTVSEEEKRAWLRWEIDQSWIRGHMRGLENALEPFSRMEKGNWKVALRRGQLLRARNQPGSAASAFAQGRQMKGKDYRLWIWEASCRLQTADQAGYRAVCEDALRRFGDTQVPELALEMGRICIYGVQNSSERAKLLTLAQVAAAGLPTHPEAQVLLGGALFRNDQVEAARKVLQQARKEDTGTAKGELAALLGLLEVKSNERTKAAQQLQEAENALKLPPVSATERIGLQILIDQLNHALK